MNKELMLLAGFACAGSYADPSIQNNPGPDSPLMSETVKTTISQGTGPIGTQFWWALVVLLLITVAAGLVVTAVFPTLNGDGIVAFVGWLIVVNAAIVSIALLRAGNRHSPASGKEWSDR
jgi:hypothetical protein